MKEYFKNDILSEEFIHNTWFFTGDKGYLDTNGNLILRGRVRNEINKSGIKIMPEDIDMQLEKNASVVESCTFGVSDPISGQDVNVAIVLNDKDKLNEVKNWLSTNISDYKFPTKWFVLDSIPKTERGKVNRDNVAKVCYSNNHDKPINRS